MTTNSEAKIATLRSWYETREPELLAKDIRWEVLERFPSGGTYLGREHVFDTFFPAIANAFARYEVEVEDMWPTDRDDVIAVGHYIAQRRLDEPEIRARFAHIWTIPSEQITQFRHVVDTAAFKEVA